MVETKSLKVNVESEQSCIDDMANFGWELKSSQEINVKESHLESDSSDIYSVTTSEHYVKLVFSRDRAMPNYSKIIQLENEYYDILKQKPKNPEPFSFISAFILFCLFVVPCVLYSVYKYNENKKYKNNYSEWNSKFLKRSSEILSEARVLVG